MSFFKDPAFQALAGAALGFFVPPLLGLGAAGGAAASGAATAAGSGSGAGLASGLTGATTAPSLVAPSGVSGAAHMANLIGNPAGSAIPEVASPSLFSQVANNKFTRGIGGNILESALGGSQGDVSTMVATPPQQQPQVATTPPPTTPSLFSATTPEQRAQDEELLRRRRGLF